MTKMFHLALALVCIATALTGCKNETSAVKSTSADTKPKETSAPLNSPAPAPAPKLGLQDMRAVSNFLSNARNEGAPVQVRSGQAEGAIEYPAVMVFGKDGCFAGSFITMSNLTAMCKTSRSSISDLPQALIDRVDPKSGGVVLVWVETEYECEACIEYRSAAMAFAKDEHPSRKYEEYKISIK